MRLAMGFGQDKCSAPGRTSVIPFMAAVKSVWLGSLAVSSLFAVVDVVWLWATVGVGRLAITSYISFVDRVLFNLPIWIQKPFDLTSIKSLMFFLFLSLVATLLLATVALLVVLPLLVFAEKLLPNRKSDLVSGWPWGRLAFPTVFLLVGFPGVLGMVHKLPRMWVLGLTWEVTGTVAVALWGFLFVFATPGKHIQRFTYGVTVATVVIIGVAGVGAAGLDLMRPGVQASATTPSAKPPNILLVSIDSLRYDHLHCYGYPRETSPVIDQLAREGARFTTAVVPTSWTLPSHVTLLTALPPELHGVVQDWVQLKPGPLSLSHVLWQRGYNTAGLVSGPFLRAEYGFARGFDHYDDYTAVSSSHELSHRAITSPALLALAQDWLSQWDSTGRERPFFFFLHMWDVHYDYTPPAPYDRLFDSDYAGTMTGENFERGAHVHPEMDRRDLEHLIALYDGEIRYTDHYLGKIIDLFKERGVLDSTIVVVTSDHGDEFLEHGNKGHRKTLYDETILVPLIIRYPELIAPGTTVDRQVRLMDIAPTVLSLAGVESLDGFGGEDPDARDLSPLLGLAPTTQMAPLTAFSELNAEWASVRTESSKLIMSLGDPASYELYDLTSDPKEQADLIPERPEMAEELEAELLGWRRARQSGPSLSRDFELRDEQIRQLRALGYID
jgi:arylsulfatase A-like enzyme